jgi:glycosyltransferase involved in cell wall biosynthesis
MADLNPASPSLLLSIVVPARNASQALNEQVPRLIEKLEPRFGRAFEILVVANGHEGSGSQCLTVRAALELSRRIPQVALIELPPGVSGKGRALQEGVTRARGQWIITLDADLPFGTDSLDEVVAGLEHGAEFITANRRLPESRFSVPTRLLHLAWRRHMTGLRFNRLVRLMFPLIQTRDTQAGLKGYRADFAKAIFPRVTSPGFYFDIEVFLFAIAQKRRWREFAVVYNIDSESSTLGLMKEFFRMMIWLPRIWWQWRGGRYG